MNNLDFLDCAKQLLRQQTTLNEVNARSSISRAYYCLYHESFDFLLLKYRNKFLKSIKSNTSPEKLIDIDINLLNCLDKSYLKTLDLNFYAIIFRTFQSLCVKYFQAIAKDFKEFRLKRNDADYDLDQYFDKEDANAIVINIEKIISTLKNK